MTPPNSEPQPPARVLELLDDLREACTAANEDVLEGLLGRIAAIYVVDDSALGELDIAARRLVQKVSGKIAEEPAG